MNKSEAISEWKEINQPFELDFQKCYNYRDFDAWDKIWNRIFKTFGFEEDAFQHSFLVDIGCGSRPALSYFSVDNEKHCVDPLLSEFLNIEKQPCGCNINEHDKTKCTLPGHTNFHYRYEEKPNINVRNWFEEEDYKIHPFPYEEFILPLENRADFVLCWNVLDHGYDWRVGIENIIKYLKTDGMLLLATDFERHKFHIGIDNPSELKEMIEDNFEILQTEESGTVVVDKDKRKFNVGMDRDYMVLGKKK